MKSFKRSQFDSIGKLKVSKINMENAMINTMKAELVNVWKYNIHHPNTNTGVGTILIYTLTLYHCHMREPSC